MNILAIGNSFSEDATAYLHDICSCGGVEATVVNLYIGGCSLKRHCDNIIAGKAEYMYQLNGAHSEKYVDIDSVLRERKWDAVFSQQCSHYSGLPKTYHPYAKLLFDRVRSYAPGAKRFIMQTWAYEIDSDHGHFPHYENDQQLMYSKLNKAYISCANNLSLPQIRVGEAVQTLRARPPFDYGRGGISLCRDGFHLDLIYGRYLAAATVFETLTGKSILHNTFVPPAVDGRKPDGMLLEVIKETVHEVCRKQRERERSTLL